MGRESGKNERAKRGRIERAKRVMVVLDPPALSLPFYGLPRRLKRKPHQPSRERVKAYV